MRVVFGGLCASCVELAPDARDAGGPGPSVQLSNWDRIQVFCFPACTHSAAVTSLLTSG